MMKVERTRRIPKTTWRLWRKKKQQRVEELECSGCDDAGQRMLVGERAALCTTGEETGDNDDDNEEHSPKKDTA